MSAGIKTPTHDEARDMILRALEDKLADGKKQKVFLRELYAHDKKSPTPNAHWSPILFKAAKELEGEGVLRVGARYKLNYVEIPEEGEG